MVEFGYGALTADPQRVGHPLQFELTGRHSARRDGYRVVHLVDEVRHRVVETVQHRADVCGPR